MNRTEQRVNVLPLDGVEDDCQQQCDHRDDTTDHWNDAQNNGMLTDLMTTNQLRLSVDIDHSELSTDSLSLSSLTAISPGGPGFLQELQGYNSPISSRQGTCIRHGTAKQSSQPAHRRTEQSRFMPGRPTIDRIVTLNTVIQSRKDFQRGLFGLLEIDLKAAFDSVDRKALWKLLCRMQPWSTQ